MEGNGESSASRVLPSMKARALLYLAGFVLLMLGRAFATSLGPLVIVLLIAGYVLIILWRLKGIKEAMQTGQIPATTEKDFRIVAVACTLMCAAACTLMPLVLFRIGASFQDVIAIIVIVFIVSIFASLVTWRQLRKRG